MPKTKAVAKQKQPSQVSKFALFGFGLVAILMIVIGIVLATTDPSKSTVVMRGELVCLPHKSGGPHTLECAYGLKSADSNYYALKNRDTSYGTAINTIPTGKKVEVSGTLQQGQSNTYKIIGTITVDSIKER